MGNVNDFRNGEALTPARLNELVHNLLQTIIGGDGILVQRSSGRLIISQARRDRGIWAPTPGDGAAVGDASGAITSQTANVGSALDAMRTDGRPGLALVGDPADGTPAATATLEFTQDGAPLAPAGLQVKIGDSYDGASVYAKTLQVQTAVGHEGLTVKLDNSTGLNPGASGVTLKYNASIYNTGAANKIGVQFATDPGLELIETGGAGDGIRVKIKAASGITRDGDGLSLAGHHATHESGGSDAIKLDDLSAPDDNTDLNASTTKHGLCPKLGGGSTNFLRADGTWAAPPSTLDIAGLTAMDPADNGVYFAIYDSTGSSNKKLGIETLRGYIVNTTSELGTPWDSYLDFNINGTHFYVSARQAT